MSTARSRLFGTTVLAGAVALAAPAFAQTAPSSQTEPEAVEIEEIIVTGSRIARPNLEQPAPVSTITRESIEDAGTVNLGDILAELPGMSRANTVRGNANSGGTTVGLSNANLRGLGASRTLTLVNGKRHVGGSAGSTAVDLNSIPSALVERYEVVTGGASAIYGSDAVSGVVNIILRDDFEGAEVGASYGIADDNLNERWAFDATVGGNFMDGRGNAAFTFLADGTERVMAPEVPELALNAATIINPADPTAIPGNGIPNRLWANYVGSEWIDERGVFMDIGPAVGIFGGPVIGFDADGNPVSQPPRTGDNSSAFGSFAEYCDTCFFQDEWVIVIPESQRIGFNTIAHFDIMPNVRAYVDAKYLRSDFDDNFQPSFRFFEDAVAPDNAFLTPEMIALAGPYLGAGRMYVNRFLADTGGRQSSVERATARIVTGLEGTLETGFADIDWDLSYNYGRTTNDFRGYGTLIPGNYAAAIDAVLDPDGNIVCRSTLDPTATPEGTTGAECVPYNPFIAQNSPEALAYVTHDSLRRHILTQQVVTGVFNFDTSRFLNLPGGAIGFAGGFEYREESSENINDAFVKTGLSETAPQPDAIGGFDVTEWFAEVNLPILADLPFAHRLTADAAYRFADYSHSGEAEAWKVGLLYAPIPDVSFRGTYGEAVRAPNITEAFLPTTATFYNISDPCDPARIDANPNRRANCEADPEVPVVPFPSNTNASIEGTTGGNLNLRPESSESFTAGVVVQPRWVPGLAVTLDYFDIVIEDAIASIAAQTIINNCYDAPGGLATEFCDLFDRETDPGDQFYGNIVFLRNQVINTSRFETSGWDLNATYTTSLEDWGQRFSGLNWMTGRLTGSMKATWTDEFNTFQFQNRPDVINESVGEIGTPELRVVSRLTYAQGPLSLTWEARFEDEVATYETTESLNPSLSESSDIPYIEAQTYHDLIARLRLDGGVFYANSTELYFGVNNITNERLPYSVGFGRSEYELFGRQYFGGLRVRF